MGQTILTPDQQKTLDLIRTQKDICQIFYLTGGTALSEFYLKHRLSDDLDFFTSEQKFPQFEVEALAGTIKKEIGADSIEYKKLYDRRLFFFKKGDSELKVEFTYYPFLALKPKVLFENLQVDSLEDIVSNKFMALLDRIEAKDFVDIYFIFKNKNFDFDNILTLIKKKFEFNIDSVTLGSEFAKVRHLTELPRMIESVTLPELKLFFSDQAKRLGSTIIER